MLIQNYPVGWAVDAGKPEPVLVYLIDLPGVAMQGKTLQEALAKLEKAVPGVLDVYRRDGTPLPTPSAEPNMRIGGVRWLRGLSPERIELGADIQLQPA